MEKKKFNLKKALMGYSLVTRDGSKVMLTGLAMHTQYPLVGVVLQGTTIVQLTWDVDGKWSKAVNYSNNDLFLL